MAPAPTVTVEFYGMARRRAGRPSVAVRAATVAEALRGADLAGLCDGGRLAPHYLVSVNAGPFLTDLAAGLAPGDRVLVLSADAGG